MDAKADLRHRLRSHRRRHTQGALSRPALQQAVQAGGQQRIASTDCADDLNARRYGAQGNAGAMPVDTGTAPRQHNMLDALPAQLTHSRREVAAADLAELL